MCKSEIALRELIAGLAAAKTDIHSSASHLAYKLLDQWDETRGDCQAVFPSASGKATCSKCKPKQATL